MILFLESHGTIYATLYSNPYRTDLQKTLKNFKKTLSFNVFEISNVHNERNINLKFVILVRIHLNGFSGDCKSKK